MSFAAMSQAVNFKGVAYFVSVMKQACKLKIKQTIVYEFLSLFVYSHMLVMNKEVSESQLCN